MGKTWEASNTELCRQRNDALAEVKRLTALNAELVGLLAEADPRIIWEHHGLGRSFSDRVEAAIAKTGAA